MSRIDYYHDPAAPAADSLVPSVTPAVVNNDGRLLLIHKIDNNYWALPGGAMDPGESVTQAAVREVEEETGVKAELTGLVGIYSDPGHVMQYDDGEVRQEFSVCFHAHGISGEPRQDNSETKAAMWVNVADIADLEIHPSMRRRIDDALAHKAEPQVI